MFFVPNAFGGGNSEDGFVNVAFLLGPCRLGFLGPEIRQRATRFLDPFIVTGPEGFEILVGLGVFQPPPERRAIFDRILMRGRMRPPRSYLRREKITCAKKMVTWSTAKRNWENRKNPEIGWIQTAPRRRPAVSTAE